MFTKCSSHGDFKYHYFSPESFGTVGRDYKYKEGNYDVIKRSGIFTTPLSQSLKILFSTSAEASKGGFGFFGFHSSDVTMKRNYVIFTTCLISFLGKAGPRANGWLCQTFCLCTQPHSVALGRSSSSFFASAITLELADHNNKSICFLDSPEYLCFIGVSSKYSSVAHLIKPVRPRLALGCTLAKYVSVKLLVYLV